MYGGEPCRRHYPQVTQYACTKLSVPICQTQLGVERELRGAQFTNHGPGLVPQLWELSLVRAYFRGGGKQEQGSGARGEIDKGERNLSAHPRHPKVKGRHCPFRCGGKQKAKFGLVQGMPKGQVIVMQITALIVMRKSDEMALEMNSNHAKHGDRYVAKT